MTCPELEILLCDYVDGTLRGGDKLAVERHLAKCAACAELARDAAAAVSFIERAAAVEPPPEMVTRILFEIPAAQGVTVKRSLRAWLGEKLGRWFEPVLQPRFAMGMAMTILSFSMLGKFSGISVRQLRPSDLEPAQIYASLDYQVRRGWERAVKYYENLRLVYMIQSRLKEWSDQEEQQRRSEERPASQEAGSAPRGERQGR